MFKKFKAWSKERSVYRLAALYGISTYLYHAKNLREERDKYPKASPEWFFYHHAAKGTDLTFQPGWRSFGVMSISIYFNLFGLIILVGGSFFGPPEALMIGGGMLTIGLTVFMGDFFYRKAQLAPSVFHRTQAQLLHAARRMKELESRLDKDHTSVVDSHSEIIILHDRLKRANYELASVNANMTRVDSELMAERARVSDLRGILDKVCITVDELNRTEFMQELDLNEYKRSTS